MENKLILSKKRFIRKEYCGGGAQGGDCCNGEVCDHDTSKHVRVQPDWGFFSFVGGCREGCRTRVWGDGTKRRVRAG